MMASTQSTRPPRLVAVPCVCAHTSVLRWGIWAPSYVNGLRSWSDQRGLNAMQMLSFLNAAYVVTGNATFMDAIVTLSNNTNQYQRNQLNLKIEAPCDDNFSDDELAFLPYYTYFQANASATPALAALVRSYNFARPQRSSLWAAIYMASTGVADDLAVRDVVWNLQTWPLEWVNWEANNSQRIDIQVNPEVNRDLKHGTMSVRVLPCNERNQVHRRVAMPVCDCPRSSFPCSPGSSGGTTTPSPWTAARARRSLTLERGWLRTGWLGTTGSSQAQAQASFSCCSYSYCSCTYATQAENRVGISWLSNRIVVFHYSKKC